MAPHALALRLQAEKLWGGAELVPGLGDAVAEPEGFEVVDAAAALEQDQLAMAFKHLIPRLGEIELAGKVARLRSAFVGGIKRLPIRYRISKHAVCWSGGPCF